jgi:hypothetical protein
MKTFSGFTQNTAQNLLLDSGAFFVNFDLDVDTYENAKAKLLGATSGGGSFNATPSMRQIAVDGVKGVAKGLNVIESWEVTLGANLLEFSASAIKNAIIAAQQTDVTIQGKEYKKTVAKSQVETSDFIDNLTWVGTLSGSNEPVIIQIYNALSTDGLTIEPQDNNDNVASLTFMAHYDTDNLDNPPFAIYYPEISTDTTAPTVTVVPADAATGVAVGANIVWTFSEAISVSSVNAANFLVLKASDGTVVAGTLTHSVDKTTVTFDPSSNLSASTAYIAIANTNIVDLAGNHLAANSVVNFTTA